MNWTEGYTLLDVSLSEEILKSARAKDFAQLDQLMRAWIEHTLTPLLQRYKAFDSIEHILSYRRGEDPFEEDGIWHDDGSRVLAFSLSLNVFGPIQGGSLGFRKKGTEGQELGPFAPGKLLIFLTGQDGFEHRTARVLQGERLVCAGWCS